MRDVFRHSCGLVLVERARNTISRRAKKERAKRNKQKGKSKKERVKRNE
jgi:hypothetical protein